MIYGWNFLCPPLMIRAKAGKGKKMSIVDPLVIGRSGLPREAAAVVVVVVVVEW